MSFTDNLKDIAKTAKETVISVIPFGSDEKDVRNILKRDHQLVSGMIDSLLSKATSTDPKVKELCQDLRNELLLHAKSEEQALYRACERHGKDVAEFAQEGVREHALVEQLLDRMVSEKPGRDGELRATLKVLKEILDHHVREEEGDLFMKLQSNFSEDQLITIGEDMEDLKDSIEIPPPRSSIH